MKKLSAFLLGLSFLIYWGIAQAETTQKSLVDTLSTEKTQIESLFDQSYVEAYNFFISSSANFLSSMDYKWLQCLWVINDKNLLEEIQNESKMFKISYLEKYSDLYANVLDIEQKKRVLDEKNISLFPVWLSYESEKTRILSGLSQLSEQQDVFLKQFAISYKWKVNKFVEDFQDYSQKNKTLLNDLSVKIKSSILIEESYDQLMSDLLKYQSKLSGTWINIFEKLPLIKEAMSMALDVNFQAIIDREIKRNKNLINLDEELSILKESTIAEYQKKFDESVNSLLKKWYNNKELEKLSQEVDNFLNLYYDGSNLQCSKVLANDDYLNESAQILSKIKTFSTETLSGNSVSSQFQTAITKWIPLIIMIQNDTNKSFNSAVSQKRQELLSQNKNIETTESKENQISGLPLGFKFTVPFTKWQSHPDIKILQRLLNWLWFYSAEIDGVYSNQTLQAVYQYQMKHWLLKWYENQQSTRWWMGPATRNKLNQEFSK